MLIGFDHFNLDNAAHAVMASAAAKAKTDLYSPHRRGHVDLTNHADVKLHLMEWVEADFAKSIKAGESIEIARVKGIVFTPVGWVYELHQGVMSPPPICKIKAPSEDVTHLAYFWAIL